MRRPAATSAAWITPPLSTQPQCPGICPGYGLKGGPAPDLVLTHSRRDHHQDHRQLAELTWNTFRDAAVLEYEIPKYDPDLGNPNLFVPLTRAQAEEKVAILMSEFPTQRHRAWFTPDTFTGLMRLCGMQCNAPSGFAEGFYAPKLRL